MESPPPCPSHQVLVFLLETGIPMENPLGKAQLCGSRLILAVDRAVLWCPDGFGITSCLFSSLQQQPALRGGSFHLRSHPPAGPADPHFPVSELLECHNWAPTIPAHPRPEAVPPGRICCEAGVGGIPKGSIREKFWGDFLPFPITFCSCLMGFAWEFCLCVHMDLPFSCTGFIHHAPNKWWHHGIPVEFEP